MATYADFCDRSSAVYRIYDTAGRLLYVGISTNPEGRLAQHRCRQPWGRDVAAVEVAWFADREAAKSAEAHAIRDENPLYNLTRPRLECC